MPTQDFKGTLTGTGTFTADETAILSSKAPKASPVFTGDVTLAGKVVNTTLPAFLAFAGAQANVTGDSTLYTLTFGTEIYDQGANFDGTIFTAPVTGKYSFSVGIYFLDVGAAHTLGYLTIVASNRTCEIFRGNVGAIQSGGELFLNGSIEVDMDALDTIVVKTAFYNGTKIIDIHTTSYFSGHLIC